MTYVELIVVLGIFAVMLSISLFNYKKFQSKVDIKNLANDIALKLVEAQKSSSSGKLASSSFLSAPAYGVYFNTATSAKFVYFADLDNQGDCDAPNCISPNYTIGGEVLDVINITKGNTISSLRAFGTNCPGITSLSIIFKRPSSTPIISTTPPLGVCVLSYVSVTITSPQADTAIIELYPSGGIQIR